MTCVLLHVRPYVRKWNWKIIHERIELRRRYERHFRDYLQSMLPPASLTAKLKEMEEDQRLDPFNIVLARQKARVAVKGGATESKVGESQADGCNAEGRTNGKR